MIGITSNPKKEITIPYNISEVKKSLGDLQTYLIKVGAENYKQESYNELVGELRLSTFEFLSFGVYIIFNVKKIDETQTTVNIEVQRKVGAFDATHEVGLANRHLNYLTDVLYSLLRNETMDLGLAMGHNIVKSRIKIPSSTTTIIWLLLFFPYGLYYMWKNKVWSKITRYIITGVFTTIIISSIIK